MSDRIQASTQSGATITGPFISESLNDGAENRYKAVGTRAQCEVQRQIWRALRASRLELEPNGDGQWQLNASFAGLIASATVSHRGSSSAKSTLTSCCC